ncbi:hypothetical protein BDV06DRAFT_197177 [Aspergillus oleicola]
MRQISYPVLAFCFAAQSASAVQLWSNPSEIPTAVPLACREALSADIACPNNLIRAQDVANGAALTPEAATLYCTFECWDSLKGFQEGVYTDCGQNTEYILNSGSATKQFPAAIADELVWAYNVSCIEDSTGFCLSGLYDGDKQACSDCALKYGASMMNSDYGRNQFPLAAFSSLLSSCSVPASSYTYSYTPLPTATATTTSSTNNPIPTPVACRGSTYIVQEADTCESISRSKSIATDRMIQRNNLDYACSSLVVGAQLCIEDTCTIYTVKANDTCSGIIQDQSFGLVQLIGWNPTIHEDCDNLDAMVGRSLCVSPPGGDGEFTLPNSQTRTVPSLPTSIITSWVTATPITSYTTSSISWYEPIIDPDYTPTLSLTANTTYTSLLDERKIYCWVSEEELEEAELSLELDFPEDCLSLYHSFCEPPLTEPIPTSTPIPGSCTPTPVTDDDPVDTTSTTSTTATTSAVATPTPTQAGMVAGCTEFHQVAEGDQCGSIANDYDITLDDFYRWNPGVGDACGSLWLEYYVCVGISSTSTTETATTTTTTTTTTTATTTSSGGGVATPTPTQVGMVAGCTDFHSVEDGDQCDVIASEYGISSDDFYTWNPGVGTSCSSLWLGYYVCVGRRGSSSSPPPPSTTQTTAKPTTTTSAGPGSTPTPTQAGMASGCNAFHRVSDGDQCGAIATKYGITLSSFYSWNPGVGSSCGSLWLGYYVCVGKS